MVRSNFQMINLASDATLTSNDTGGISAHTCGMTADQMALRQALPWARINNSTTIHRSLTQHPTFGLRPKCIPTVSRIPNNYVKPSKFSQEKCWMSLSLNLYLAISSVSLPSLRIVPRRSGGPEVEPKGSLPAIAYPRQKPVREYPMSQTLQMAIPR